MSALLERVELPTRQPARAWGRPVLLTCGVVVVVRLVLVIPPLRPDEAGYLMSARQWHSDGEFAYGDYYVDRPPLLMLLFRLAALTDWDRAIRLVAVPFAVLLVVAAARAALLVAGPRAGAWAAFVAGAFAVSPAVGADPADGELFAAPLVMASVALALAAWQHPDVRGRLVRALAAGLLAAAASLVKQNFLEGFVFAAVLAAVEARRSRRLTARGRDLLGGLAAGSALLYMAAWVWTLAGGRSGVGLWTDLAAFRQEALEVIWAGNVSAPVHRGVLLAGLALVSGMAGIGATWLMRRSAPSPEDRAVTACLCFGLVAVLAGGSYWPHYLLQLAPALALATGLVAVRGGRPGRRMRRWASFAAGSALVGVLGLVAAQVTLPVVTAHQRTGEWLAESSRRGDTAVVAYGSPSILEAADLASPYPYLWSLPMRVRDPRQELLRSVLAGPRAPTWWVVVIPVDSWGIDRGGRLRGLVGGSYTRVATVCGAEVWLREDARRDLAPVPAC